MTDEQALLFREIEAKAGRGLFTAEVNQHDGILTVWSPVNKLIELLGFLKNEIKDPYRMLVDITAVDMRAYSSDATQPDHPFIIIYQLLSYERNDDIRIKSGLDELFPEVPSITGIWPSANWYEREVYDMFGIGFKGHPHLSRILMPANWDGHPLRKEHPARATEMAPFTMPDKKMEKEEDTLQFKPEEWGMERYGEDSDFMFLNLGPQHPGTHGVLRLVLQLSGEEIIDIAPDIGFHHRGAEKMAERQSWHTYIPYTDRVDYLSGVLNNLAYLQSVEKLAGIEVPDRAKVIRVMMSELFRMANHLVWYGTFAQDIGQMSPVFYMFSDREKIFDIVGAICGARMHPNWFRIGGVAQDLPEGWEKPIKEFIRYFPARLKEYDTLVMHNKFFRERTKGIGIYTTEEAIEWGVTGPGLRATGFDWDFRKKRPYSGYDQFDFEIPVAANGDCYDRGLVRIEEMRQSLRIVEQCVNNMPSGPYKSDHPLTTPPRKNRTMHDIETLINHFVNETWGPVMPKGEVFSGIENAKGYNAYHIFSNGNTTSYRTRIRTPSFAHLQMIPYISKGYTVADLVSILGSIDFVLSDVDR
ncbi:MAG TPA: NADH-quinone oxidoreductase subunit C/D [Bacteroidales bacterium]|nr:NADH-quinone oxidoreductase subunit C/D [Bacteroidales bacterium]